MALERIPLVIETLEVPAGIASFITDAQARIDRFRRRQGSEKRIPSFVTSNFQIAYHAIRIATENRPVAQRTFCEWGSGLGVVACLAALRGFAASGIEERGELVQASRDLARAHQLPVSFHQGSYKPPNAYTQTLSREDLCEELSFAATDFDLTYVYPWPAEERIVLGMIAEFAVAGARLITYHGGADVRLYEKRC